MRVRLSGVIADAGRGGAPADDYRRVTRVIAGSGALAWPAASAASRRLAPSTAEAFRPHGGKSRRPGAFRRYRASGPAPPAIRSFNPADVPFVLDTIPPPGVNVQTELDPTANPAGVQLQGLTVP